MIKIMYNVQLTINNAQPHHRGKTVLWRWGGELLTVHCKLYIVFVLTFGFVFAVEAQQNVGNTAYDDGRAYKDLLVTYSNEIDEMKKSANEQQQVLDKFVKDYKEDREQMGRIFESITDRLDRIDGNMKRLDEKIGEIGK